MIKHRDNYPKILKILCLFYRHEVVLDDSGVFLIFTDNNSTESFKPKEKIVDQRGNMECRKMVLLIKYLSNFWRILEMQSIN